MILAAGRGERLRPVTDTTPKALVEIQGQSLLERHLDAVKAAGVETVVINLGWLGEQVAERVGSGLNPFLHGVESAANATANMTTYPRMTAPTFRHISLTPFSVTDSQDLVIH